MKNSTNFDQAYRQLNHEQREAVDSIGTPLLVVAGPGTGKTQVLTMRIANILKKTDADPYSILALTFTEAAAKNMQTRLASLIGPTAYSVNIHTFHSFCVGVIKGYSDYFPIARDSEPLADLEKFEILEKIITDNSLELIKPMNAPLHYLKEIMSGISNLKREGVTPERLAEILNQEATELHALQNQLKLGEWGLRQRNLFKQQELLEVYRWYQAALIQRQRYDFDDMIMLVVEAFQSNELLLRVHQEKLQYLLVDEYQDTNSAQNRVVDLLASYWPNPDLCVVGDPHQAIFRFQGASVENILGFVDRYPQSTIINLATGYRCSQQLYDAAHQLVSTTKINLIDENLPDLFSALSLTDDTPALVKTIQQSASVTSPVTSHQAKQQLAKLLSLPLKSESTNPQAIAVINLFAASNQKLEAIFVARQIQALIAKGVKPSEIAVIYRYNADSIEITEALSKWGIRYQIDGGDDLLQRSFTTKLLNFLQVLDDLRPNQEDELVFQVLNSPWFQLEPVLIIKLGRVAGKMKLSLLEVIDRGYECIENAQLASVLSQSEFDQLKQIVERLYEWRNLDHQLLFTQWFERVLHEAGIFTWLKQQADYPLLLTELNTLYREIKNLVASDRQYHLASWTRMVKLMKDHKLQIKADEIVSSQEAVCLLTAHKAKGQEWEYVFIVQAVDGKWGGRQSRELLPLPSGILQHSGVSKNDQKEDEKRLFYVALTRAKQKVTISYPEEVVAGARSDQKIVTQFVEEIKDLVTPLEDHELVTQADELMIKLIEPPSKPILSIELTEFISSLVQDFTLSITALNNYLRDPQDFLQNTLLRLPRAKEPFMSFGTAVHSALERFYAEYLRCQQYPDEQYLLDQFEQALNKELLTDQDHERRLRHGQDILRKYYHQRSQFFPDVIELEKKIGSGRQHIILDKDIRLSGKIDRLDWIDREKKLVKVIDYKTGKAKSANDILGLTKSTPASQRELSLPETIRGSYMRQLVFYKLLCQLDPTFKASVVTGAFEFVEPAGKNSDKIIEREFKISDEAVDDLKALIRQVMKEIRELAFFQ